MDGRTQATRTGGTEDWTALDPDEVDAVADEITTLAAHIHAATHRLLTLIAAFDGMRGWERDGHRSCAHWLAFRTGIDLGAAREKVRAARALEDLPQTSAAMARGALSFAKVRALTRVATPANEGDLLELAQGSTAAELERMVRGWRLLSRKDEAELERIRHASRTLSVFPGDDGMYVVRGRLDPEVGALLMRAVEAATDALYRAETRRGQRDGDHAAASAGPTRWGCWPSGRWRRGWARGCARRDPRAPSATRWCSTWRPVRWSEGGEPGRSELEDGTRVSAETSRRVACDASVVEVAARTGRRRCSTWGAAGARCRPPSAGRWRPATAAAAFRGADPGSPTPTTSCTGPTEARRSWTTWCSCAGFHHRLVHEEGYRLELNPWPGGRPVFYDPRGLPVPDAPPVIEVGAGAVDALIRANRARASRPRGIRRRAGGRGRRTSRWASWRGRRRRRDGGGRRSTGALRRGLAPGFVRPCVSRALLGVPESPECDARPPGRGDPGRLAASVPRTSRSAPGSGDRLVSDRRGGRDGGCGR